MEPTSEITRQLWDYMTGHYGSHVIKRSNAIEMRLTAQLLGLIGAVDTKTFMEQFATTLGTRIYVPFEVGTANASWSLWDQITTCVHEHQHVVQYQQEGQMFLWKYLLRSAGRAHYEADAYRCDLEMHYWRTGEFKNAHKLAELLRSYKCNATDIAVTEKQFDLTIKTLEHGAIINSTSRRAIKWLNHHAPELQQK